MTHVPVYGSAAASRSAFDNTKPDYHPNNSLSEVGIFGAKRLGLGKRSTLEVSLDKKRIESKP